MLVNAMGAGATGLTLIVVLIAKFTSGACESEGWEIGINANQYGIVIGTGGSTILTGMQKLASY